MDQDPKDGDLYADTVKSGETLMEADRVLDVQISPEIYVKERKTHRTI